MKSGYMMRELVEKFMKSCITDSEVSELVCMLNEIFVYKNEWALDGGMIDLIRYDEELFDIAYDAKSWVYYFTFNFEYGESCVLLESYIVDSENPMVSLGRQLHLTRAEVLRNEVDRLDNLKLFYEREIVRSEEAFKQFQLNEGNCG
jgi:hypothetical protein